MASAELSASPELPSVPGYRLGPLIGRGGFASVYLLRDRVPGSLDSEAVAKIAHLPGDPRMAREAAILGRLGPPMAPALLGSGTTGDGRPFLLLEHLGTDSLALRLARLDTVPRAVVGPFGALCAAVDRMHDAGILHRDLKPENVFFRPGGQAALIDFGLARMVGDAQAAARDAGPGSDALTGADERLGTWLYMAPEQWLGTDIDHRADLYALGVILFEWLTGRPPFVGSQAAVRHGHVTGRLPRPSEHGADPAVDDVVLRSLAKDPAQRFARAADLADALAAALERQAPPAPAQPASTPAVRAAQVALLGARMDADAPRLLELAQAHDAVLAVTNGAQHVLAFPWAPSPAAGVRQAVAAARRCLELTGAGPCVVHVAALRIRESAGRIRLHGDALRAPTAWATAPGHIRDIWLTAAAAGHADAPLAITMPDAPGGLARVHDIHAPEVPAMDPQAVPLRGRDALLFALEQALEAMLSGAPAVALLLGEPGLGKTGVLHALCRALRPRCQVVYVRGEAAPERDPDDLGRELLRLCLDADSAAPASVLAALHQATDPEHPLDPAARTAAALLVGELEPDAPELAALRGAPGALRHARAQVLSWALCRKARQAPLAVMLDDGHRADHATLDALRLAAAEPGARLAVLVAATPALLALRPDFCERVPPGRRHAVQPLDRADADALARDLLWPVEFVPDPVLARIHEATGGAPLLMVELARAMRAGNAIRRHPGHRGYYLAADTLGDTTTEPLGEHLARRLVAGLPPTLAALVELCAVLGPDVSEADVRGVQAELTDPDDPLLGVDVGAGLSRLIQRDVVVRGPRGHALRHAWLGHAILALLAPARKRAFHAAALRYWHAHDASVLGRIAHHAAGAGASDLAAASHLALAERACDGHHYALAEQHHSQALEHAAPGSMTAMRALAGRGRMRYRLQRMDDALADLAQARALAEAHGQTAVRVSLLLEQAKVLDWRYQAAAAATIAREAAPEAARQGRPELEAAADLALGRALYREDRHEPALVHLTRAAAWARAAGDHETLVIALLLMAPTLVYLDRLDAAERCFDEVIERCRAAGDLFHLATARLNRATLWIKRRDVDALMRDMQSCIPLGRTLGNAQFERIATYNLAETLYWTGDFDQAQALARRSRALQLRFFRTHHNDALLLARIDCALGKRRARAYLGWIRRHCQLANMSPSVQALLCCAELAAAVLAGEPMDHAAWERLAQGSATAPLEEHIEILVTAAETAHRAGDRDCARAWHMRAKEAAATSPMWRPRLARVAAWLAE